MNVEDLQYSLPYASVLTKEPESSDKDLATLFKFKTEITPASSLKLLPTFPEMLGVFSKSR